MICSFLFLEFICLGYPYVFPGYMFQWSTIGLQSTCHPQIGPAGNFMSSSVCAKWHSKLEGHHSLTRGMVTQSILPGKQSDSCFCSALLVLIPDIGIHALEKMVFHLSLTVEIFNAVTQAIENQHDTEFTSEVSDRQPNVLDYLLAQQSGVSVIANTSCFICISVIQRWDWAGENPYSGKWLSAVYHSPPYVHSWTLAGSTLALGVPG